MTKPVCSIFFHNYYGNHADWIDFFIDKITVPSILYYNIVSDSIYNLEDLEPEFLILSKKNHGNLQKIIFRKSPNKGKDLGGKLLLIDAYQKIGMHTNYGLFFHDKKSIYKANNTTWANELFKIIEPDFQNKALKHFNENKHTGIVAGFGSLINEYNESSKSFISKNNEILIRLQEDFSIFPPNYNYVAGTMFWFRMEPIDYFFKKFPALQVRGSFEYGNITDQYAGSHTHCWERLLSWIITMQNYKINVI